MDGGESALSFADREARRRARAVLAGGHPSSPHEGAGEGAGHGDDVDSSRSTRSIRDRRPHRPGRRSPRAGGASTHTARAIGAPGAPAVQEPRRGRAAHQPSAHPRSRAALGSRPRGGTEFEQLREFSPDDEFRRIDWSATARTAKLIVRTYRAERNQTVLLLLDTGRVMAGQVDGVPRLEHAMDAVMMMTAVTTRLGDRAGLLAFGRQVRAVVPPSGGGSQLPRIVDAMYDLDAQLAESDYRAAFSETMARFRRRAARGSAHGADRARDRGDAVARPSRDGSPPSRARGRGARSRCRRLGSRRCPPTRVRPTARPRRCGAIDERRRAIARLQGMGASVIDASPGRLAPALADAYLKVKATGRL